WKLCEMGEYSIKNKKTSATYHCWDWYRWLSSSSASSDLSYFQSTRPCLLSLLLLPLTRRREL
ncbi:MAG: hypothetical protein QOK81_06030, partial [Nitrososphaeraceae archaeon]|nr:hypothetical protein [Nitrososphaeraceae archaeon]